MRCGCIGKLVLGPGGSGSRCGQQNGAHMLERPGTTAVCFLVDLIGGRACRFRHPCSAAMKAFALDVPPVMRQ